MRARRSASVAAASCLFIAAGTIGLVYHTIEFAERGFDREAVWVLVVRLLAIIAGVFMLRQANWARWLAVAWLGYHVVLSAFHSPGEMAAHALLLLAIAYVLFRPGAYIEREKA